MEILHGSSVLIFFSGTLGSLVINQPVTTQPADSFDITVYRFNPSTSAFEVFRQRSDAYPSDLPYVVENVGQGFYVVRLDAKQSGLPTTVLTTLHPVNVDGKNPSLCSKQALFVVLTCCFFAHSESSRLTNSKCEVGQFCHKTSKQSSPPWNVSLSFSKI